VTEYQRSGEEFCKLEEQKGMTGVFSKLEEIYKL
jgi:hypothetical protein